jgi:hypothetical protein
MLLWLAMLITVFAIIMTITEMTYQTIKHYKKKEVVNQ